MVIAALVSFGALFVAWILAPNDAGSRPEAVAHDAEALPIAA